MLRLLAATVLFFLGASVSALPAAAQAGFPIDPEASCVSSSCHDDMAKQEFVHAAAADGEQCVTCHEPPQEGRHAFELAVAEEELCAMCHGDMADKEYKHVPVAEGMCTFCHDPHQSDNPKQLNFPPNSELCFNCHDSEEFEGPTTHGPVGEGQCLKCHDPHTSDHAYQLRAEPPDLCFGCHNRALKDPKGRTLPAPKNTFRDDTLNLHPPFEAGMCLGCHLPHAGANYRLLLEPYPETLYASFSPDKYVCFMCHDDSAFAEARTLEATEFRNGNLNLHYRHVNRQKGRSCKACHHHHGAPNERLIRDKIPFGKRTINIRKFERTQTGGSCSPTCHRPVSYDRYEPVFNTLKVTPREGVDATPEELERAKEEQLDE